MAAFLLLYSFAQYVVSCQVESKHQGPSDAGVVARAGLNGDNNKADTAEKRRKRPLDVNCYNTCLKGLKKIYTKVT